MSALARGLNHERVESCAMNYQCLILCLLLVLMPSCARKPAVDQPMHQFLYSVQNTDEALQKLGEWREAAWPLTW